MYATVAHGLIKDIQAFIDTYNRRKYTLTRAPLGCSAERAPLGGGQILPPV